MNDIVSIRKIRPLPDAGVCGGGAAVTCVGDFFLGGNWPSLTVRQFSTTEVPQESADFSSIRTHGDFQMRVCPCVPLCHCGEDSEQARIIWSLRLSPPLSAEC